MAATAAVCAQAAGRRASAVLTHNSTVFPHSVCWDGCPPPVLPAALLRRLAGGAQECRAAAADALVMVEERNQRVAAAAEVLGSAWLEPGRATCRGDLLQPCPDCTVSHGLNI